MQIKYEEKVMGKFLFVFGLILFSTATFAQKVYRNEMGGIITKEQFEEKILNGPYFGIPSEHPNEMLLIHRMPFGQVEPDRFYAALGLEEVQKEGKPIVVIYYPGKDECNSTGNISKGYLRKGYESLVKGIEKRGGYGPVYIFKNPSGLEKFNGIMQWRSDPDGIFEKEFFKFHYLCQSFVVISPDGRFEGILGEFPGSQIIQSLKDLTK